MSWLGDLYRPSSPSALGLDRTYIIPVDNDSSDGYQYAKFQDQISTSPENDAQRLWRHKRNKSHSTEYSRPETWYSIPSGEKWARCYATIVLLVMSSAFISFLLMTFKPRSSNRHRINQPPTPQNETYSPSDLIPIVFPHHGPDLRHITSVFPSTSPSLFILPSLTTLTPTQEPSWAPAESPEELPSTYPTPSPSSKPTGFPTFHPSSIPSSHSPTLSPTKSPSPYPTTQAPSKMPTKLPTTTIPSESPTIYPSTETPSQLPSTILPEIFTTPFGRCLLPNAEYWSTNSQLFNARIHVLNLQSFSKFSANICWRISPTHPAFSCEIWFHKQEDCKFVSNPCEPADRSISLSNITYDQDHFEFTLIENDDPEADFSLFPEHDTASSPSCSFTSSR